MASGSPANFEVRASHEPVVHREGGLLRDFIDP
jgi:hypothetical protein